MRSTSGEGIKKKVKNVLCSEIESRDFKNLKAAVSVSDYTYYSLV